MSNQFANRIHALMAQRSGPMLVAATCVVVALFAATACLVRSNAETAVQSLVGPTPFDPKAIQSPSLWKDAHGEQFRGWLVGSHAKKFWVQKCDDHTLVAVTKQSMTPEQAAQVEQFKAEIEELSKAIDSDDHKPGVDLIVDEIDGAPTDPAFKFTRTILRGPLGEAIRLQIKSPSGRTYLAGRQADGNPHGLGLIYYPTGEIRSIVIHDKGIREQLIVYYPDGTPQTVARIRDGKTHEILADYWPSGILESLSEYNGGDWPEHQVIFDRAGKRYETARYVGRREVAHEVLSNDAAEGAAIDKWIASTGATAFNAAWEAAERNGANRHQ